MTLPDGVERDYSLARLTTVRAGGPADLFARPDDEAELARAARAGRRRRGSTVAVVGSGSNLLVSDDGYRGLVVKLDGELSAIERQGTRVVCGGGARLPSAAAQAARWGLSGLEFGINIPGTVGGAVKMNANAYGGELGRVLEWVNVCTAGGVERREPGQLGFSYRRSNLRAGRDRVPGVLPARARARSPTIKAHARRDARQAPRGAAVGDQDLRLDLQEPRRRCGRGGRTAGQLLEAGGLSRAPGRRRALLRASMRTSSRTPAARRPPTFSP